MRFFLFLSFSIFSFGQDPSTLHPFTDINGRTLQAKLIEAGAESVKVEWNGQTFDLPLDSLDLTTRNLVRRLTRSTSTKGSSDLHDWTDTQGRNIKAKFVKADQASLTLDWNGKVTTLPLSNIYPLWAYFNATFVFCSANKNATFSFSFNCLTISKISSTN